MASGMPQFESFKVSPLEYQIQDKNNSKEDVKISNVEIDEADKITNFPVNFCID